jgi:aldose 1-epimerase
VIAPSGEQFELAFEDQRAVVTEVGGGLRAYRVREWEVVAGYGVEEMASGGRGQVLIPWPNRLRDGSYEFDGRTHQLPLNEVARSNAIHGLVRWASWTVREQDERRVVVEHMLHPQPGYPFSLEVAVEYELSELGLAVRTTATNVGTTACPYGSGAHPYLSVGTTTVDDALLRVPARTLLRGDERAIPVDAVPVAGELDFRSARRVGSTRIDDCFTDLERDTAGVARVELEDEDGCWASVWMDASYPYVMVFTGDLGGIERRGLAIEPMTCAPNAFRSGDGLVRLEPGETHRGTWGITPHHA